MKIKGILFDKDGTILKFHGLWPQVLKQLVKNICNRYRVKNEAELTHQLLSSIGVTETEILPNGIFASGTTDDIAESFLEVLKKNDIIEEKERLKQYLEKELVQLVKEQKHLIFPTADLHDLFSNLKKKGIKLGIATADDYDITMICLKALNVTDYFDFIGTSDFYEKKPSPHMFQVFCEKFNLASKEVAMVGDNLVDMQFASNSQAGLKVGVLTGTSLIEDLANESDYVIEHIGKLFENGSFLWEAS
ncbi:HAD family hydrolase [Bacillus sp. FJAT-47783]|uniref:HAD family hydrolase n=1 Tax=Bacillus sp. FJAT-47783 TaxID=2922712 RepID=UPI001FAC8896|nr:HAD family hydrolase [Bacillus sp. FJAT-47783]